MEEEGEEELKVGAAQVVLEVLECPVPSGSQLPPPPHSLFQHHEHSPSSQTELLARQTVPPGGREAPNALLPNFLASPRLPRPKPPDPGLAAPSAGLSFPLVPHVLP